MSTATNWRLLLASAAILAQPLAAQDGSSLNPEFKIREGLTAGTLAKDLMNNETFGFALANVFPLKDGRSLSVELGYDVFAGANRETLHTQGPVYFDLNGTVVSADPTSHTPLYLSQARSTDTRSFKMEGFSVRVNYQAPVPGVEGLSWQAGLSLDRYKSSSEFMIDLIPVYDLNGGAHSLTSYLPSDGSGTRITANEGYANQVPRAVFTVGAQAGLVYQISKELKVEANVRNLGYGLKNYTPLAYSGTTATLSDKNGRGNVFEIGFSMTL